MSTSLAERALAAAIDNPALGAAAVERAVELLQVLANEPLVTSAIRIRARRYLAELADGNAPGNRERAVTREESWPEPDETD